MAKKVTIYVKDNDLDSVIALDIAGWLKNFVPSLDVCLINASREDLPEELKNAHGPVYEIAGRYFVGNPNPQQLKELLKLLAEKSIN